MWSEKRAAIMALSASVSDICSHVVRCVWPIAPWILITVFAASQNPAIQAIWAGWASRGTNISWAQQFAASISLFVCSFCMYVSARAMVDVTKIVAEPATDQTSVLRALPLASVLAFIACLIVASNRTSTSMYVVWFFVLLHSIMRASTIFRAVDEPRAILSVGCLLSVAALIYARRPDDRTSMLLIVAILVLSEILIEASTARRRKEGVIVAASVILLLAWIYWRAIDLAEDYMWLNMVVYTSALPLGIAGMYWARSVHGAVRLTLGGVATLLVLVGGFTMWVVGRDLAWPSMTVLIGALITSVTFCLLQPTMSRRWRVRTYHAYAVAATIAVFALSCTVIFIGRQFTELVGSVSLILLAFGLWGLILVCGPIIYLRLGGKVRYLVVAAIVVIGLRVINQPSTPVAAISGSDSRRTLSEFVSRHVEAKPRKTYYVVAAEGGGLRAAVHTASVLEALNRATCGEFASRLIAISTVSGGSLGAIAYLNSPDRHRMACPGSGLETRERGYKAEAPVSLKFLANDFLAHTIGELLFPNVLGNIVPFDSRSMDRGDILREDWEDAWRQTGEGSRLDLPYLRSNLAKSTSPALLMNSTSVATGERVVLSTKRLGLSSALDLFDIAPQTRGISISAAVLHSARFPLVTPAGPIWTESPDYLAAWSALQTGNEYRDGSSRSSSIYSAFLKRRMRLMDFLVDGGYFENYGAETLLEAVHEIRKHVPKDASLRVILIHNEPARPRTLICTILPASYTDRSLEITQTTSSGAEVTMKVPVTIARKTRPYSQSFGIYEGIGEPISAFMNAREARGRLALVRVKNEFGCKNIEEAFFLDVPGFASPPLTWYLDPYMHAYIASPAQSFVDRVRKSDPDLFNVSSTR